MSLNAGVAFVMNTTSRASECRPFLFSSLSHCFPLKLGRFLSNKLVITRRGTFISVEDPIATLETVTDGWNQRCGPSV
jgi:hypothetical protein